MTDIPLKPEIKSLKSTVVLEVNYIFGYMSFLRPMPSHKQKKRMGQSCSFVGNREKS